MIASRPAAAATGTTSSGLSQSQSGLVGPPAGTYVATRRTSQQINGMVGSVVETIHRIAASPPSDSGQGWARWGPFTPPLAPLTLRLSIHNDGPGTFQYVMEARPKEGGAFAPVVQGHSQPGTGSGVLEVNGALLSALDPVGAPPGPAAISAQYGTSAEGMGVQLQITAADGTAAHYAYNEASVGAGAFQFAAHANLAGDPSALEDGIILSRWTPTGAGRADAAIHGGDVGDGASITECWNELFTLVYARHPDGEQGDPSACAFSEPLTP